MKFESNRDVTIHSIHGHSLAFVKGIPLHVPRVMHTEVMEKGILPVAEDGAPVDPSSNDVVTEPKVLLAPTDQMDRDDKILEVMKAIVATNNPHDFTGGGMPHPKSITSALGWKVDTPEVRKVWDKNKEELKKPK